MTAHLEIKDLHVAVEGKEILKGIDLTINAGEIHAIMGPNGSGKSTLANTLAGHPKYQVTQGDILFKGESILEWAPDERAQKGIFLAFQYPMAIPGVTVANFLRTALNAQDAKRRETADAKPISIPGIPQVDARENGVVEIGRYLRHALCQRWFFRRRKKRVEILQMAVLNPEFAVLDETDSGLDIDALRIVSEGVNAVVGPHLGVLLITHYQRILNYIKPQFIHVMVSGKIAMSGGPELALAA